MILQGNMKKSTIWLLAVIMALTFVSLLAVQLMYMENMIKMRNEQFTEAAKRSLYAVSTTLELDETKRYLWKNWKRAKAVCSRRTETGTKIRIW